MARLEVRAADDVDGAEAVADRPADVDAGEVGAGEARAVALGEACAAERELGAAEHQRGQRAHRRLRELEADVGEDVGERVEAVVDVAGAEELLGGAAAQIERLVGGRVARGVEVGARGLDPAAGVGEGVGELLAEGLGRVAAEVDRLAVEGGGAIEGQRALGAIGGDLHEAEARSESPAPRQWT